MTTLLVHVLVHADLPSTVTWDGLPSEQAEQAEPARPCRKCKCGTLVLRAQKARPTVDTLMRMPPDMECESDSAVLQLYLPLTGFL